MRSSHPVYFMLVLVASVPSQWASAMDDAKSTPAETEIDVQMDHSEGRYLAAFGQGGGWLCCVPCEWLRRNNSVHQASLGVVTLLVTALLVASPVLFLISAVPASDVPRDCRVQVDDSCLYVGEAGVGSNPLLSSSSDLECSEPPCLAAATRLLGALDRRADPCTDFYQFACGRWSAAGGGMGLTLRDLQTNVDIYLQQLLANGSTIKPFHKLGQFYKGCLDIKNIPTNLNPIFSLLDELGGYLPPGSLGPGDLTPLLGQLLRLNGAALFDVRLDPDPMIPNRLKVFIDVPRQNKDAQNKLKNDDSKSSQAYVYIKNSEFENRLQVINSLLNDFLPKKMSDEQRTKEIQSVLMFATNLSKLFPRQKDIVSLYQQNDFYQEFNISRLQTLFPIVKWENLFEEVLSWNSSDSDTVFVMSPGYLSGLTAMVSRYPKRIVHNSLLLLYARELLPLLNATGHHQSQFCLDQTTKLFPREVSALYSRQFPSGYIQAVEKHTKRFFSRLRSTLRARIQAALWLDIESRVRAVEKVNQVKTRFLHGPESNNEVEILMEEIQIDPNNFFGNVIRRFKQIRTINIDFNSSLFDQKHIYAFRVNAYYEPCENTILIPLALVLQPQLTASVPSCLIHGSLGIILAHELLHGFDLYGVRFNSKGVRQNILSPSAHLGLEARVDCVARQYTRVFRRQILFMGHRVQVQFDWNITRNENMADISALQTAHQTWQTARGGQSGPDRLVGVGLGPRQLFFVAAAQMFCSTVKPEMYVGNVDLDSHAPSPERVNGVMMNSPSFSEAFSCPVGSPMNPMKKCSTW